MFKHVEGILGLVATVLGLIGLRFAVFGPTTFSYDVDSLTAVSVSLWNQGIDTNVAI